MKGEVRGRDPHLIPLTMFTNRAALYLRGKRSVKGAIYFLRLDQQHYTHQSPLPVHN